MQEDNTDWGWLYANFIMNPSNMSSKASCGLVSDVATPVWDGDAIVPHRSFRIDAQF